MARDDSEISLLASKSGGARGAKVEPMCVGRGRVRLSEAGASDGELTKGGVFPHVDFGAAVGKGRGGGAVVEVSRDIDKIPTAVSGISIGRENGCIVDGIGMFIDEGINIGGSGPASHFQRCGRCGNVGETKSTRSGAAKIRAAFPQVWNPRNLRNTPPNPPPLKRTMGWTWSCRFRSTGGCRRWFRFPP